MNLMTMELVLPVLGLSPHRITEIFSCIGATPASGYAILDSQYGAGARYAGPLIRVNDVLCTWTWCSELNKLSVKPFVKTENCLMVAELPVTVTGAPSGHTVMFKTEKDAIEWLNNLTSIEQLKLMIQTPDYNGSVMMYLTEHKAEKAQQ